jgi:hypothetical protein
VGDTEFSVDRGFYTQAFTVAITTDTPGATIRYTTDGTAPTPSTGTIYTSPVPVATTTFIRAIAYRDGYQPSNIDTHSYLFLADVLQQDGSGLPATANWGHGGPDWDMDPEVVNDPRYANTLTDDLLAVPSISVVMDWDDLWAGGGQGIYIAGESDPRAASFERITADGTRTFQENGSIQIQGQSSTGRWKTDKLSLRAKFTEAYGPSKLRTRLFEDSPVEAFDTFVLDAVLNLSWLHPSSGQRGPAQYIQDQVVADLQNLGGGRAPHGSYVHLYLNGVYWGMYYLHERPDAGFHQSYAGGEKDDWNVIKHTENTVVDGSNASYMDLIARMALDQAAPANHAAVAELLDIDDFILYMLCNYFLGNTDWAHKNLYASQNEASGDSRWRFHSWDAEHVVKNVNQDITGRRDNAGQPTDFHHRLRANDEYNLRFADIVHRHFFNGGIMSPGGAAAVYSNRVAQADRAIVGESARWGDNRDSTPRTRDDDWLPTVNGNIDNYFPQRTGIVLNQLKADDLYPPVDAPVFTQHGGAFTRPLALGMSGSGTIYYTLDGSDPREAGTGNAVGTPYTAPLSLTASVRVKARVRDGGTWSALNVADFIVHEPMPFRVSEIMYNASSNEFVEIVNTSTVPASLLGYAFTEGIAFAFAGDVLGAGEYLVVVDDLAGFQLRYPAWPSLHIAGQYAGDLDKGGETLSLENATIGQGYSITYNDGRDWWAASDGAGHSLVPLAFAPGMQDGYGRWWRPSAFIGGSPAAADPTPLRDLVLNEIAAATVTGQDWFEVFNPTAQPVDTDDWYFSNEKDNLKKTPLSSGSPVDAGGWAHEFQAEPYGLRQSGEQVFLSYLPGTSEDRVADALDFPGQQTGVSYGRYPDGDPYWQGMPQTPGSANGTHSPSGFIHEVMYHPAGTNAEYIVLFNPRSVDAWRLRGEADFDFAPGSTLALGDYLVMVPFDPADAAARGAFEAAYGAQGDLVGPFTGKLDNHQGHIALQHLVEIDTWVVEDEVYYVDREPFADSADGTGLALHRVNSGRPGSDPAAWRSGLPSPGDATVAWPPVSLQLAAPWTLSFLSFSNLTYTLESTPLLKPPAWSVLQVFNQAGPVSHVDLSAGAAPARYYRVRIDE